MKKLLFTTLIVIPLLTASDVINDGAVLTIDEGCIVTMDGNFESTGSVHLNGTLQISGELGNVETIMESENSLIEFIGDGQTIPEAQYARVLISGGGTKILGDYYVSISDNITIIEGSLDLNGGILDLGTTGTLTESPGSVVFGEGYISKDIEYSEPAFVDIGGIGLTTDIDMYDIGWIKREHQSINNNGNNSIKRSFTTSVTSIGNDTRDIIFRYDETELNGLNEHDLMLFQWDESNQLWEGVESSLDVDNNTVLAMDVSIEQNTITAASGGGCTDPIAANHDPAAFGDNGTCEYVIHLEEGNNLVSFPGIPSDTYVQNLMSNLECPVHIVTKGIGLFNVDSDDDDWPDTWSGNLNYVNQYTGYYVYVCQEQDWIIQIPDQLSDRCMPYFLPEGNNLVSFVGDTSGTLDALGEYINEFMFVIGLGLGRFNCSFENNPCFETLGPGEWSGNLNNLHYKKGYWVNVQDTIYNYTWNADTDCEILAGILPTTADNLNKTDNNPFKWIQSTEQAFYLPKRVLIDGNEPESGDYIVAFYNDKLVGSVAYIGDFTPVPVMGKDITSGTEEYPEFGDKITLKLFSSKDMKFINLQGDIPGWRSMGVFTLGVLSGSSMGVSEILCKWISI